jgi:RNA polymerase sigma factor (TIGR02999 family)
MADVTAQWKLIEAGDSKAAVAELLPLVYDELRRLASARLARKRVGQTLQPTALVHEAYVRLVGDGDAGRWDNRSHFFAAAAEAMRRFLVENARRKARLKHGSGRKHEELSSELVAAPEADDGQLVALDALWGSSRGVTRSRLVSSNCDTSRN